MLPASYAKRLMLMLLSPRPMWRVIAAESRSGFRLFVFYILPFSLAAGAAVTVGVSTFNREWHEDLGYGARAVDAIPIGMVTAIFAAFSTYVLAWVFQRMAGLYKARFDFVTALAVSVYGTIPIWLIGTTLFFMPMVVPGLLAFGYSCMLYSMGAEEVLGIPRREAPEFVAMSLLFSAIILSIAGMLAASTGLY